MTARILVAIAWLALSCQSASPTPAPPTIGAPTPDDEPSPTGHPSAAATQQATPSPSIFTSGSPPSASEPPIPAQFEYVRFLAADVAIHSELAGDEAVEWTHPDQLAAVLESAKVGDVDWIRVEVGSSRTDYRPIYGWVPRVAEVTQGGRTLRVDPVYEPAEVSCPSEAPTVTGVAAMLPAQAVECYGTETLRFSPVQVWLIYSAEGETIPAEPKWLTFESLWVFDSHQGALSTSMGLQVDPASGVNVPVDEWVEIEGRFDHHASATCRVTGDLPHHRIADRADPIRWCREKFVVSAARVLLGSERPPNPAPPPPLGPPASRTIDVTTREITGPLAPRFFASGVWTGSHVIVWGGADPPGKRMLSDGAAYDPKRDRWRVISDGPLTEREQHLSAWTGTEMLIWGGRTKNYIEPPDGAAYDPVTDSWRPIADGPLEWVGNATSVWTGTEWIIAATYREGRTRFAAYDPAADAWRTLPPIDAPSGRPQTSLTWTGDQLILRDFEGSLKRLPRDAPEWIAVPIHGDFRFTSAFEWTGKYVIGVAWQHVDHSLRQFVVGWDPASDRWLSVPQAPRYLEDRLVWADGRAILLGSDLAYDTASQAWWEMPTPDQIEQYGDIVLWAGDRLFVWGGGLGHGTTPNEAGSVSIPDWLFPLAMRMPLSPGSRAVRTLKDR